MPNTPAISTEADVTALADQLRAAAAAYYDTDELLISDAECDAGIETLREDAKVVTSAGRHDRVRGVPVRKLFLGERRLPAILGQSGQGTERDEG